MRKDRVRSAAAEFQERVRRRKAKEKKARKAHTARQMAMKGTVLQDINENETILAIGGSTDGSLSQSLGFDLAGDSLMELDSMLLQTTSIQDSPRVSDATATATATATVEALGLQNHQTTRKIRFVYQNVIDRTMGLPNEVGEERDEAWGRFARGRKKGSWMGVASSFGY